MSATDFTEQQCSPTCTKLLPLQTSRPPPQAAKGNLPSLANVPGKRPWHGRRPGCSLRRLKTRALDRDFRGVPSGDTRREQARSLSGAAGAPATMECDTGAASGTGAKCSAGLNRALPAAEQEGAAAASADPRARKAPAFVGRFAASWVHVFYSREWSEPFLSERGC